MGLEIEAKMRLKDFAPLLRRLKNSRAKAAGEVLETNIFFDTPDNALRSAGMGLRLRANRNIRTGNTRHVVTFKGPRRRGSLKTRPEFEFSIDNPSALIHVLNQLGYAVRLTFQKRRRTFSLRGCKVELDELPHLGEFVEIEGPGVRRVMAVRKRLGLSDHPLIKASYASMLARYLADNKIRSRKVEFRKR
jgi:predicted adenylyl cyclase CyaB